MITDTSAQDRVVHKDKSNRRLYWMLGGSLAALALAWLVWGSTFTKINRAEHFADPDRLSFAVVERGDLVKDTRVEGRIKASSFPTLFSPTEGRVALFVKPGTEVTQHQLLAKITGPELKNQLLREQSALAGEQAALDRRRIQAKADLLGAVQTIDLNQLRMEAAKRALARTRQTYEEGLTGAVDYEKAVDDAAEAEMTYQHSLADKDLLEETIRFEHTEQETLIKSRRLLIADLERRISDLEIRSPADGIIGTLSVAQSDRVTNGQALMTVIDLTSLDIEIKIPEIYADEIGNGTEVEIRYENQGYEGMVTAVSPEVNNGIVLGTVAFRNQPPQGMRQNQRVEVRIIMAHKENVLRVRRGPFIESSMGRYAYTVRDGMAYKQAIEVGTLGLNDIEILAGLREGDQIIISDTTPFADAEQVYLGN